MKKHMIPKNPTCRMIQYAIITVIISVIKSMEILILSTGLKI